MRGFMIYATGGRVPINLRTSNGPTLENALAGKFKALPGSVGKSLLQGLSTWRLASLFD